MARRSEPSESRCSQMPAKPISMVSAYLVLPARVGGNHAVVPLDNYPLAYGALQSCYLSFL